MVEVDRCQTPLGLHETQAVVDQHPARYKVVRCGRRWGKTTWGKNRAIVTASAGKKFGWFAPNFKYQINEREWLINRFRPMCERVNKTENQMVLTNGGVIDFWTMDNEDAGRGRDYDEVYVDEAGLVRNFKNCWLAAIKPTLTDRRGRANFGGTPKGFGYFDTLFRLGQSHEASDWMSWQFGTVDNPHIPREEIEEARGSMPDNIFAQEYLGIPDDEGGNPFGREAITACRIPSQSTSKPSAYGVDLAKSYDWTWVVGLDAKGNECHSERWQSDWPTTRNRILSIVGNTPTLIDSTGVGSPILDDLSRERRTIDGYTFSNTSKQHLMDGLRTGIQSRGIGIADSRLIEELNSFAYEYLAGGKVRFSAPPGEHDDGVCALALAWQCKNNKPRGKSGFAGFAAS